MATEEIEKSDEFANLLCFQHCCSGGHISCFEIPRICPCCKEDLYSAAFAIPPFSLPSPFTFAKKEREKVACSLLIKPTLGNFLNTYKSGDDLHIGISDSIGRIFSFDEDGITESHSWECCLLLKVAMSQEHSFSKTWDSVLHQHVMLPKWQKQLYNTESHNCFSFVLEFLNSLSNAKCAKEEFCDKYILPLTKRASEYIAIYRAVMKDGVYLHPT